MRKLLLLALLLYDIVALATRSGNHDYDDLDGNKRHHDDDRRSWRKKSLMKNPDLDHNDWEERRRHDYDMPRYSEEPDKSFITDRQREPESNYKKRLEEVEKLGDALGLRSGEMGYMEKEVEKKVGPLNCDRPHERYEGCFAGCASVTCDNPRDRLRPCYPFCEAGCVCVSPYVRDDRTHKCVLPDDCSRGLKGIPDLDDETK